MNVSFDDLAEVWKRETGRAPGVWAHLAESYLSVDDHPSPTWKRFEPIFSFSDVAEIQSVRRYPEILSDKGWHRILHSKNLVRNTDSGWLRDAMDGNDRRIEEARSSNNRAFNRAAKSLQAPSQGWMTASQWTQLVTLTASPFDPSRSEWTALEILRQLVFPIVNEIDIQQSRLDRLHPNNVLVPKVWTDFPINRDSAGVSWEAWRNFVRSPKKWVTLRDSATSILDYRYFAKTHGGHHLDEWERRLVGVGRLLLGLLRCNHDVLRIWNIRGNEKVFSLPRTRWFNSLAISSPTLLLMEGCLSVRSAETRAIFLNPSLFGWQDGLEPNDTDFDPPILTDPNDLLKAIEDAQLVLVHNQLSIAMNQPRQLIPFRLSDFSISPNDGAEADIDGE